MAVLLVLCYGGALLLPQIGPLVLMTTVRICDTKMRGRPHIPLRRLLMFPAQSCRIAAHSCARVRQVGPHNVGSNVQSRKAQGTQAASRCRCETAWSSIRESRDGYRRQRWSATQS